MIMSEITLPHLQNMLQKAVAEHAQKAAEKKEVLQNTEKKLVSSRILGHLRMNHTFTVTLYLDKTISRLNTS